MLCLGPGAQGLRRAALAAGTASSCLHGWWVPTPRTRAPSLPHRRAMCPLPLPRPCRMDKRRKKERRKRREQKVKSKVRAAQLSQVRAGAARWCEGCGGRLHVGPWNQPAAGAVAAAAACPAPVLTPSLCFPIFGWQAEGIAEDNGPEQLFSLSKMKGKLAGDAAAPDFDEAPGTSSSSGSEGSASGSEADSEEEQRRWVDGGGGRGELAWAAGREQRAGVCMPMGEAVQARERATSRPSLFPAKPELWAGIQHTLTNTCHALCSLVGLQVRRGDGRVFGGQLPGVEAGAAQEGRRGDVDAAAAERRGGADVSGGGGGAAFSAVCSARDWLMWLGWRVRAWRRCCPQNEAGRGLARHAALLHDASPNGAGEETTPTKLPMLIHNDSPTHTDAPKSSTARATCLPIITRVEGCLPQATTARPGWFVAAQPDAAT